MGAIGLIRKNEPGIYTWMSGKAWPISEQEPAVIMILTGIPCASTARCILVLSPLLCVSCPDYRLLSRQRQKRRWVFFQPPYSGGRSRHGAPVRKIQKIALTKRRLSLARPPQAPPLPGKSGANKLHAWSEISWRCIAESISSSIEQSTWIQCVNQLMTTLPRKTFSMRLAICQYINTYFNKYVFMYWHIATFTDHSL